MVKLKWISIVVVVATDWLQNHTEKVPSGFGPWLDKKTRTTK